MAAGPICLIEEALDAQPGATGVSDLLLERCIDAASEIIEGYCQRTFYTADYDTLHSGDDAASAGAALWLADDVNKRATLPVTNVTAITEDGTGLTVDRVPLAGGLFTAGDIAVVLDYSGKVYRASGDANGRATPQSWANGWANIRTQYTAGYDPDDMPTGLRQAAIDLAWLFYKEGGRFGTESLSISEMSARYVRLLPPWSKQALDQLRIPRQPVTVL